MCVQALADRLWRRGFEKDDFDPSGRRKPYIDIWDDKGRPCNVHPSTVEKLGGAGAKRSALAVEEWSRPRDAQVRQEYFELSYGQRRGVEKLVAKIKPYFPDEENPRVNDWYRVFGYAIASARPNEMCDICISRQSL